MSTKKILLCYNNWLNKFTICHLCLITFTCFALVLFSLSVQADITVNGFAVKDHLLEFKKNFRNAKCQGKIFYPEFDNEEQVTAAEINHAIKDFVETYSLCNDKINNEEYKVSYEIRENSADYLSIRWLTMRNGSLLRIDCLTFDLATGNLVAFEEVVNSLGKNLMPELVKLSQHYLADNTSWEEFLEKIAQRHIQFYAEGTEWHLIFNPVSNLQKDPLVTKLPPYFLIE